MRVQPGLHFPLDWRKTSHSADTGDCVEVATRIDYVLVRDSNDHNGPALQMTASQWQKFLARIVK
ncbi:MAG TPA: DUF397 domain-containing protein [Trebonia sp.]|jgi:hypothetical protein|nr:DUF397 domain-containing protein [Trebonia sp.]